MPVPPIPRTGSSSSTTRRISRRCARASTCRTASRRTARSATSTRSRTRSCPRTPSSMRGWGGGRRRPGTCRSSDRTSCTRTILSSSCPPRRGWSSNADSSCDRHGVSDAGASGGAGRGGGGRAPSGQRPRRAAHDHRRGRDQGDVPLQLHEIRGVAADRLRGTVPDLRGGGTRLRGRAGSHHRRRDDPGTTDDAGPAGGARRGARLPDPVHRARRVRAPRSVVRRRERRARSAGWRVACILGPRRPHQFRARREPRPFRCQPGPRVARGPDDPLEAPARGAHRDGAEDRLRRRLLRRLPIRQKLVAMIMLTATIVLVLAGSSYLAWEFYRARGDMARDLTAEARLILDNTQASLQFHEPTGARDTLQTLSVDPHIRAACLYDARGALFASYVGRRETEPCPAGPSLTAVTFARDRLHLYAPSVLDGRTIGTLYIRSDLELL